MTLNGQNIISYAMLMISSLVRTNGRERQVRNRTKNKTIVMRCSQMINWHKIIQPFWLLGFTPYRCNRVFRWNLDYNLHCGCVTFNHHFNNRWLAYIQSASSCFSFRNSNCYCHWSFIALNILQSSTFAIVISSTGTD